MGYAEDIRSKLNQMHNRTCVEDFVRLTDFILATGKLEMLPVLLNVINKFDSISRNNYGLLKRIENMQYKIDSKKRY